MEEPSTLTTVGQALRAAFQALALFFRLSLDRPARRRAVAEARLRLGAAAAVYLRDRAAPGFLARALADRQLAEARLAYLTAHPPGSGQHAAHDARPGHGPEGRHELRRLTTGPFGSPPPSAGLLTPLVALRRRRLSARLRAADLELGAYARGLEGTRGYLGSAQQAVAGAEAELAMMDDRRMAALHTIRADLRLALLLAVAAVKAAGARVAAAVRGAAASLNTGRKASRQSRRRPALAGPGHPGPNAYPAAAAPAARPAGRRRRQAAGPIQGPMPRVPPVVPVVPPAPPPPPPTVPVASAPAPAPAPTAPVRPGAAARATAAWQERRQTGRLRREGRREARWTRRRQKAMAKAQAGAAAVAASEAAQVAKAAIISLAEPPDRRRKGFMRFVRPIAGALVLACALGVMVALPTGALVTNKVSAAEASLPDLSQLEALRRPERSEVFDRDGNRIAVLHDEQDRVVLGLDAIPLVMQRAVISAEDERFYEHKGVDERGIVRAAVNNLLRGGVTQGGSTITQQVIRNSYPDLKDPSIDRKIKEAALAAQLETKESKRQILEDYLNLVYFGSGYYGVEAASQGYFGKSVKKLQLHEAALLAGIIRSPEGRNPRSTNPAVRKLVFDTRNAVLDKMVSLGWANPRTATRAKAVPVKVKPPRPVSSRYPFFIDYLKQRLLGDPPGKGLSKGQSDRSGDRRLGRSYADRKRALFEGGLQIRTTLDPRMQQEAEAAVKAHVPMDAKADAGLVSIDPRSGAVRAMVGGKNYKTAQFNYAWQARRNPGSSFKTFVLAAAMDDGVSPDSVWESSGIAPGTEICGRRDWAPENYEGGGSGPMSLRTATAHSVNGVFARLMGRECPHKVAEMAQRLGVTIPKADWNYPSIALGGTSVRVIDMASGYATLAAGGVYHAPVVVSEVVKRSTGKVLFKERAKGERRVSAALAYEVTNVLRGVIQGGTAAGNGQIGRPAAGKTGTAQEYGDAWFVGFTPQLSTAVWIGNPNNNARFVLNGSNHVTGGSFPTMIWRDFMIQALADQPVLDFERPEERLQYTVVAPPPTTPASTIPGQSGQPGDVGNQPGPGGNPLPFPIPGQGNGDGHRRKR